MKKRILSFLTLLCMITALLPTNITVFAATELAYGDCLYYTETDDEEIKITGYFPNVTEIVIPEKIDGKPVTSIGTSAFLNNTTLKSVTIPSGVTNIGNWAFNSCYNLEKIYWNAKNVKDLSNSHRIFDYVGQKTNGTEIIFGDTVEKIPAYAFFQRNESTDHNIVNVTVGKNVTVIGQKAFYYGRSKMNSVYYNGTENDWKKISIDYYNDHLTTASRIYFAYVNIYDTSGNIILNTKQTIDKKIDLSGIEIPDGCTIKLYKDKKKTEEYSLDTPISENMDLYYDIIGENKPKITGAETADIGQTGITESITFATDKTAKDFIATVKFSDKLNLSEITEKDFSMTDKSSETKDGYTYLYLICTYNADGNMPINTTLNPFDLVFDVSENAQADDILTVEFVADETFLAYNGTTTYDFDGFEKSEIKINPILVNGIKINGADEIDKATQYTATISPENATNKEVEWTVDNTEVATISADGTLTPIKAGTVKITATAKDGSGIYGEKSVNVKVYAQITSLTSTVGTWDKTFAPSEREYIIYVPNDTNSIKLTANHGGTLKAGTTIFYNGRGVTVSLTDKKTILTLVYTETGYTDSEYKLTIVKFEGTKTTVSDDGKTFTVTPINIETENTVILALYNGNEFVEAKIATYAGKDIPFTTDKTYTNAKVMVWNNLDDIMPICDVEIVK